MAPSIRESKLAEGSWAFEVVGCIASLNLKQISKDVYIILGTCLCLPLNSFMQLQEELKSQSLEEIKLDSYSVSLLKKKGLSSPIAGMWIIKR
jgi:hypothetical protein